MSSEARNEAHEIFIIVRANTGANPGTVVIHPEGTAVAGAAVNGPWRAVDFAGFALLDGSYSIKVHDNEIIVN